jgi:hypothetical protein
MLQFKDKLTNCVDLLEIKKGLMRLLIIYGKSNKLNMEILIKS